MYFQRWTQFVFLTGIGCFLIFAAGQPELCCGQESETTLKELQQQWLDIDAKLFAKENELKSADGDVETLQKEFNTLVDEANAFVKKLEAAAKSSLESHPDDPEVVRTLIGVMVNDAQFNRDANVLAIGDLLIANGVNSEYFKLASRMQRLAIPAREIFDELIIRQAEAMKGDLPRVKLSTTQGDIVLELYENEAPNTVGNFINLVEKGYYTDMIFHRVIEGFMAQGGGFKMEDGKQVGGEGPGYAIKCECESPEKRLHFSGCISMAHKGKDTAGSQFFLTFSRTVHLDGLHTCFGRVIQGQDVLEKLARTHIARPSEDIPIPGVTKDKIIKAEVIRKRDHEYLPDKVAATQAADPAKAAVDPAKAAVDPAKAAVDPAKAEVDPANDTEPDKAEDPKPAADDKSDSGN